MAIKNVTYKEPASYFTPEMLKAAEEWSRQHKKISFVMGDITKIEADAIVNAANESIRYMNRFLMLHIRSCLMQSKSESAIIWISVITLGFCI